MPHDHQQDQYEFEVIEIGVSLSSGNQLLWLLVHRSFVLVYRRVLVIPWIKLGGFISSYRLHLEKATSKPIR